MKKTSIRGMIIALNVGDQPLSFPKEQYKLSTIRAATASLTGETGKKFTVSGVGEIITVTRNS